MDTPGDTLIYHMCAPQCMKIANIKPLSSLNHSHEKPLNPEPQVQQIPTFTTTETSKSRSKTILAQEKWIKSKFVAIIKWNKVKLYGIVKINKFSDLK